MAIPATFRWEGEGNLMDWIKMRSNLRDDPAVWAIAKVLKMDPFAVLGRLHTMWAWFDAHATPDDPSVSVSPEAMDDHLRCSGWCSAVADAGWLIVQDDRLTVPNFDRHMGQGAKERAMAAVRKSRQRTNSINGIYRESNTSNCHAPVTFMSRQHRDMSVTKTGHDKSSQDKALGCHAPTVTFPGQNRDQREERRGEREEESRGAPPPIQSISSNQIPNPQLTRLEQFVDQSPEARAAALAEYRARIEAHKARLEAEKATKGEGRT